MLDDDPARERAYTVAEACARLGHMSRSRFYGEVRAGRLRAKKAGTRTIILESEIARYLRQLPELPAANG